MERTWSHATIYKVLSSTFPIIVGVGPKFPLRKKGLVNSW